jgi:hypothetical protein
MPNLKCGKLMELKYGICKTHKMQAVMGDLIRAGDMDRRMGAGQLGCRLKKNKAKRPSTSPAQSHISNTPTLKQSHILACAIVNHTTMCHQANTPYEMCNTNARGKHFPLNQRYHATITSYSQYQHYSISNIKI